MLAGPLPKQIEHRKLAEQKATLEGSIAIEDFSRLAGYLCDTAGEVGVRLRFRKGKDQKTFVTGSCVAEFKVICQTCLEPMSVRVRASVRTFLVESADELALLCQHDDGIVCEGMYIDLVDLVEDDVIVGLPMVPRHEDGGCVAPIDYENSDPEGPDTHRPFAGLSALKDDLKRSK